MKKIKKEYTTSIIAGIVLVFLGIFFQISNLAKGIIPLIFMNAGTIMIVIAVLAHNKYGAGITQDERTRAIGARALSYSWLFTFVLINVLFWIDYTKIIELNTSHVLGIIFFTMILSASIIQSLLKKRGVINED
ncbi:MAG: hypothetical protein ACTSVB_04095 [Candidatus Heimdallarchaeaceae archaeon]